MADENNDNDWQSFEEHDHEDEHDSSLFDGNYTNFISSSEYELNEDVSFFDGNYAIFIPPSPSECHLSCSDILLNIENEEALSQEKIESSHSNLTKKIIRDRSPEKHADPANLNDSDVLLNSMGNKNIENEEALSQENIKSKQNNAVQKRPRGRPPKKHADPPNLNKHKPLTEKEYKKRWDNNEASRKCRLKAKVKKNELPLEEKTLMNENEQLKIKLENCKKTEMRLKDLIDLLD